MITKRINTHWKRFFLGILLSVILVLWVRTLMAAGLPASYYDFECASDSTAMPINMQTSANNRYLILDDEVAWTVSGQGASQTISWSGNQTVKYVYYYVTGVPSGVQAEFKFTIGTTVRYSSVTPGNNSKWVSVNFGSKSGASIKIERTDTNGGNVKLHEVRTCVASTGCSISKVNDGAKAPGQDHLQGKDALKRYTFIITGTFTPSSCLAPPIPSIKVSDNGVDCKKGHVLRVRATEMEIRYHKSCFSAVNPPPNMGSVSAKIFIGSKTSSFDIAYWANEAVWFIH